MGPWGLLLALPPEPPQLLGVLFMHSGFTPGLVLPIADSGSGHFRWTSIICLLPLLRGDFLKRLLKSRSVEKHGNLPHDAGSVNDRGAQPRWSFGLEKTVLLRS